MTLLSRSLSQQQIPLYYKKSLSAKLFIATKYTNPGPSAYELAQQGILSDQALMGLQSRGLTKQTSSVALTNKITNLANDVISTGVFSQATLNAANSGMG
jgi:hypothetical protein